MDRNFTLKEIKMRYGPEEPGTPEVPAAPAPEPEQVPETSPELAPPSESVA